MLFTSMQLDLTWDKKVPTKIFPEKASQEADFILKEPQTHERVRLEGTLEVPIPTPV